MEISQLLYPLSLLYRVGVYIDKFTAKPARLSKPVISIGNITWGGTGKTPAVIKLARELCAMGLKPCVLTRGYRAKKSGNEPLIVSDGKMLLASRRRSGDEPCLIAESAPGTVVIAGANRALSAKIAIEKFSSDVFILDDGFQHWHLERDLDIVCVNAQNPFGNGMLLPAGILREPVSSISRAGLVVLTGADMVSDLQLDDLTRRINKLTSAPIIKSKHSFASLVRIKDGSIVDFSGKSRRAVLALSGIADNGRFKLTLERLGFRVQRHFTFSDHHWYNIGDLKQVLRCPDNYFIVTTSKDAVRLNEVLHRLSDTDSKRFLTLEVELEFISGENHWENLVQKTLRSF